MNQKISILGCGWLGLPLAVDLIKKGFEVSGSTTSNDKIKVLEEKGIKPFLIDVNSIDTDIKDFLSSDVLIVAITSKSNEGFKGLIKKIEDAKVQKVLFISSTSVYPYTNGIVTEESSISITPLAEIEKLFVSNRSFKSTVIRFGGLYGYDRKPGNFVKPNKPVDNPEGYVNLIHRDDCIEIIEQIIFKNIWGEILNACSDDHPKRREYYISEAKKVGNNQVVFNENSKNEYKIINSQKVKRLLGYEFKHSNLI